MNIGENIKKFRIENGMTQKELADKINKSLRMVQKYESGEVEPSIDVLNDIAKVLGTEFILFLDIENAHVNYDENLEKAKIVQDTILNESLVSSIIFSMIKKKDLPLINLLDGDIEFITQVVKQTIINYVNVISDKNSYILHAHYFPEEFNEKISKDSHV